MDLTDYKALVTGAAGFIGSHIVDTLLQCGAKVIGIDNFCIGKIENLVFAMKNNRFELIKGDIRDYDLVVSLLRDVDVIFHQAALASVNRSIVFPRETNEVNVNGTLNLLTAAKNSDIKRVIFASSSSVYGDTLELPKRETMQRRPISPYAVSKCAGEMYAEIYYRVYGLQTVSLRYFNVYGARQSISEYSGVISIWINRILRDLPPLIHGDGLQTRDFTFIKDVVDANLLAAFTPDISNEIFNIGSGRSISLLEVAQKLLKLCEKDHLEPKFISPRPGDVKDSLADISKAKEVLGYQPKYTFDFGLKETLDWFRDQKK
ncbi:MAG: SDR family oxidoreductase [Promethearchaeota archaeon]